MVFFKKEHLHVIIVKSPSRLLECASFSAFCFEIIQHCLSATCNKDSAVPHFHSNRKHPTFELAAITRALSLLIGEHLLPSLVGLVRFPYS